MIVVQSNVVILQTHTDTHIHTHTNTHTNTHAHTHAHTINTCVSGPEVAIALIVSEPIACTMLLNFSDSMVAISRAFVISSLFCSLTYLVSASRALVNFSNSDCYIIKVQTWSVLIIIT